MQILTQKAADPLPDALRGNTNASGKVSEHLHLGDLEEKWLEKITNCRIYKVLLVCLLYWYKSTNNDANCCVYKAGLSY